MGSCILGLVEWVAVYQDLLNGYLYYVWLVIGRICMGLLKQLLLQCLCMQTVSSIVDRSTISDKALLQNKIFLTPHPLILEKSCLNNVNNVCFQIIYLRVFNKITNCLTKCLQVVISELNNLFQLRNCCIQCLLFMSHHNQLNKPTLDLSICTHF